MDENDEIIVGVNIPNQTNKKTKKDKKKSKVKKSNKKEVAKKATSKEKKNKARISGNSKIFRNRLIKKFFIFCIIVFALVLFLASSIFDIKDIDVENNESVSKEEIIALIQLDKNCNIFSISKKNVKQAIKENTYIEDVEIKRVLPNKLNISVVERKVKYMIQLGDAYLYVNNQGYIIDRATEKKDIPIIDGIKTDISDLQEGKRLVQDDLNKFDMVNRIYETANNNGIINLISKIDISDSKNYTIYLESEKKIAYLGNCSDLNTRILYVKAIIEQEAGVEGEIFVNKDLNEDNVFFREKI